VFCTVCTKASKHSKTRGSKKTPVANLGRNAASGVQYARVRLAGKLIWKSANPDRRIAF
jgi:hypothetical protein